MNKNVSQGGDPAALVLLDPPIVFQHVEHPQRIGNTIRWARNALIAYDKDISTL